MDFASLAIQVVSGIIVGNAICIAMKQPALGILVRTVVAAIGGALGGIVFSLIGGDSAISGPLVDIYSGGFGGAIFTPIVGALLGGVLKTRH
jgi:hypothetical protein